MMLRMDMHSALALAAFVVTVFVAALSGGRFRPGPWYESLNKPGFTPPNWLFAPAWTVLYILIAISGWLVWRVAGFSAPVWVWLASLIINAAWSYIVFGRKRLDWGFADIAALWLSIVTMIVLFAPVSRTAALLLLPYLAWVTFAGALNLRVWQLNPGR